VKILLIRTCVRRGTPPVHDRTKVRRLAVKQSHRTESREPSDSLVFPASSAKAAQATCPADVVGESFEASVMRTSTKLRPACNPGYPSTSSGRAAGIACLPVNRFPDLRFLTNWIKIERSSTVCTTITCTRFKKAAPF